MKWLKLLKWDLYRKKNKLSYVYVIKILLLVFKNGSYWYNIVFKEKL